MPKSAVVQRDFVSIIVLLCMTPTALARSKDVADSTDGKRRLERTTPQSNPTTNAFEQDPGDNEGGGNYSYCIANCSYGQKCRDVVIFYKSGTICESGCNKCASVSHSASCSCNPENLKLTGKCTYW